MNFTGEIHQIKFFNQEGQRIGWALLIKWVGCWHSNGIWQREWKLWKGFTLSESSICVLRTGKSVLCQIVGLNCHLWVHSFHQRLAQSTSGFLLSLIWISFVSNAESSIKSSLAFCQLWASEFTNDSAIYIRISFVSYDAGSSSSILSQN